MRQWLVRPELMCRQHLMGEHLEVHMFYGAIRGEKALNGYYQSGLFFGPKFLKYRHTEIKKYIHGHKTPLKLEKIFIRMSSLINGTNRYWYPDRLPTDQEMWLSWHTLMSRCKRCRKKHLRAKREGRPYRYSLDPSFISRVSRNGTPSERSRSDT